MSRPPKPVMYEKRPMDGWRSDGHAAAAARRTEPCAASGVGGPAGAESVLELSAVSVTICSEVPNEVWSQPDQLGNGQPDHVPIVTINGFDEGRALPLYRVAPRPVA